MLRTIRSPSHETRCCCVTNPGFPHFLQKQSQALVHGLEQVLGRDRQEQEHGGGRAQGEAAGVGGARVHRRHGKFGNKIGPVRGIWNHRTKFTVTVARSSSPYLLNLKEQKKTKCCHWPRRDLNTQPSDLESDALPLRHGVTWWKREQSVQHMWFRICIHMFFLSWDENQEGPWCSLFHCQFMTLFGVILYWKWLPLFRSLAFAGGALNKSFGKFSKLVIGSWGERPKESGKEIGKKGVDGGKFSGTKKVPNLKRTRSRKQNFLHLNY